MFSCLEKQKIAEAIEKMLLSFNNPEMPTEKPVFILRVCGKTHQSWAKIRPNWFCDNDNISDEDAWNSEVTEIEQLSRDLHLAIKTHVKANGPLLPRE